MLTGSDENVVLVINDAPDHLELMSLMLRHAGYSVLTAAATRSASLA